MRLPLLRPPMDKPNPKLGVGEHLLGCNHLHGLNQVGHWLSLLGCWL